MEDKLDGKTVVWVDIPRFRDILDAMSSLPLSVQAAVSTESHDPVWAALQNAPLSDEPLSDDELLIVANALEKVTLGQRGVGSDRVRAIIEEMRRDSSK